MVREIEIEPDYRPIDSDELRGYPLAPNSTAGEQPTEVLIVEEVKSRAPYEGWDGLRRSYTVEVEYKPIDMSVEEHSFEDYLQTFAESRITQEEMTKLIYRHLTQVLDCERVFVSVCRDSEPTKRTRLGDTHVQ